MTGVRVLVDGLGKVGRALLRSWDRVAHRALLVGVADSRGYWHDDAGLDPAEVLAAKARPGPPPHPGPASPGELLERVRPGVLVELVVTDLETGEPAVPAIEAALGAGVHVITSAKSHQKDALTLRRIEALAHGPPFFLDHAAMLAGIPATEMTAGIGMEVTAIEGVLNGTTNFILKRMEEGEEFDAALAEARERGFTERNHRYDIEGHDVAVKLVGLTRRFLGTTIEARDVVLEGIAPGRLGIDGIDRARVLSGRQGRRRWKLVGRVEREDGEVRGRVRPVLVDRRDPYYRIEGFQNAIGIEGVMNGTAMRLFLVGPGAGADETASRVLGNLNHLLGYLG